MTERWASYLRIQAQYGYGVFTEHFSLRFKEGCYKLSSDFSGYSKSLIRDLPWEETDQVNMESFGWFFSMN